MNTVVQRARAHLRQLAPHQLERQSATLLKDLMEAYVALAAKEQEYREMAAILSLGLDLLHEETGGMTKDDIRSQIEQLVTDRDTYIRDPEKRHGVYAAGRSLFGASAIVEPKA